VEAVTKLNLLTKLHLRAERVLGFCFGVALMVIDEIISPLTNNVHYQLPYALSLYFHAVYLPAQYVWEIAFFTLAILFLLGG
jgi:hypothetical protein